MDNGINMFFILAALLVTAGLTGDYIFTDRQAIFIESTDAENNYYQVIGNSTDLIFDGWSISFCWRRPDGPWMVYYLDHKSSRWTNMDIEFQPGIVAVSRDTKEVGFLKLQDGTFHLPAREWIQRMPVKIVAASDPFSHSASIYPGSQEWEKVWPAAINSSISAAELMELNKALLRKESERKEKDAHDSLKRKECKERNGEKDNHDNNRKNKEEDTQDLLDVKLPASTGHGEHLQ